MTTLRGIRGSVAGIASPRHRSQLAAPAPALATARPRLRALRPSPVASTSAPVSRHPRPTPSASVSSCRSAPPSMYGSASSRGGSGGRGPQPAAAATPSTFPATAAESDIVDIPPDARILLIGITGVTGRSALQGLLTIMGPGRTSHRLLAMTRNPRGAAARSLPAGVQVVTGDLDDPAGLGDALHGVTAVYCHALATDGRTADPQELVRARNLAAAAKAAGVRLILYNSSGGRGCGYGITQMEQKHQVEDVLAEQVPTVALRASMFMEELWKRYTRPGILKGTFTWSTPTDKPIQLVAARDLGLVAGYLLAGAGPWQPGPQPGSGAKMAVPLDSGAPGRKGPRQRLRLRPYELCGDALSPAEMCEVFAAVQGAPVRHNRAPAWPFWFLARDVFRISRFLTQRGFDGNVATCRKLFPGMLSFSEFLRTTGWADPARTYEDGIAFVPTASGTQPPPASTPVSTPAPASAPRKQ